jgi:hypothetical protein
MTTNNLLLSPEIVSLNYRLSMLNALVDGLNNEMAWSASCRKSVVLALLHHAISNTETDLLEAQGLSTEDEDPFTAPECIAQSDSNSKCASPKFFNRDELIDLANNHIRLNPLSEKRAICDFVVAELGEMGFKSVDGNDLTKAINIAFSQREIKVHWAEEMLSSLNAQLTKIATDILNVTPGINRKEFTASLSEILVRKNINITNKDLDRVINPAYSQQPNVTDLLQNELIAIADIILSSNPDCTPEDFKIALYPALIAACIELSDEQIERVTKLALLRQFIGDFYDEIKNMVDSVHYSSTRNSK